MRHNTIGVLLAEDDDELRFILVRMLSKEGYRVEEVSDGKTLARRLSDLSIQSEEEPEVNVVVSDIFMPGCTALEVIEDLEGGLDALPIILITSAYEPTIAQKAYALGVRAVLSKPVDMAELVQCIGECVVAG